VLLGLGHKCVDEFTGVGAGLLVQSDWIHPIFIFLIWAVSTKCPNAPITATINAVIPIQSSIIYITFYYFSFYPFLSSYSLQRDLYQLLSYLSFLVHIGTLLGLTLST
jgi:hypothetical protein